MDGYSHPAPAAPLSLQSEWLRSWVVGYSAAVTGTADCLNHLLTGKPLDLARWLDVALTRRPPGWSSPHEIVFEDPLARLRDFSSARPERVVPTLVLPPQAGHDSCIVDFSPEQTQMGAILAAGLERALSLDWVGARPETANAVVEDYLGVVDRAVTHCGGRVNLIGDCQGGWLATIYAALNPERVNTLTLAGAPIDFHAGEPVIHEVLRRLTPGGDLHFYEALVASGGGVLKGEHMLGGFISINPGDEISRQIDLLLNLDDPAHLARYREFEDWFKHTQDIPGALYLWIVRHLFRDNELVRGSLKTGGQRVDLGRIEAPLYLLAGTTDHITPPDQVFAIAKHVSTPPSQIRLDATPGGHLGLFMGHRALREHWPPLLAGVFEQSV
jgi:poly(3-hydroxyalkanoate) synthetase